MIDTSAVKQAFKDASDEEARSLYTWITGAMEVRGLIPIAGAQPQRKRRSDAGRLRGLVPETAFAKGLEAIAAQPSLSGLPESQP